MDTSDQGNSANTSAEKRTDQVDTKQETDMEKTASKAPEHEKEETDNDNEDDIPLTMLRVRKEKNETSIQRRPSYFNTAMMKIREQISKKKLENKFIDEEQDMDDDTFTDETFKLTKHDINSSDSEDNKMMLEQPQATSSQDSNHSLKKKKRKVKNSEKKINNKRKKHQHKSINTKPRKAAQGTKLNSLDIALKSSLEEHKVTVEAIDNDTISLERILLSNNLVRIDIPSDGNCFFEAALPSIGKEHEIQTACQLRNKLCNHIAENKSHYLKFLSSEENLSNNELFEQEVNFMRKEGNWSSNLSNLMPAALANFLQRGLTIYTSIKGKPIIQIEPTLSNKSTQIDVLLALSCTPGIEHYHAILNPFKSGFTCGNNTSINKQPDETDKIDTAAIVQLSDSSNKKVPRTDMNSITEGDQSKYIEPSIDQEPTTEMNSTTEGDQSKYIEPSIDQVPRTDMNSTTEDDQSKYIEPSIDQVTYN